MISFNKPCLTGNELRYLQEAIASGHLSGDGPFTKRCQTLLEQQLDATRVLLTSSGTHALEMAALLLNIAPGDEVIMPSFTFVSTANAFVLRGARIVFVDIRPDTLNLDESLLEAAITPRTKAIVPVHYAGIACEMTAICDIAERHGLWVVEDAAHALFARYRGQFLGTLGHLGCFSFHETKNFSCGEGGALLVNRPDWIERAEILREKGTNRSQFFRGQVDKYTWLDIGSSYLPSELQAAFLYAHLESAAMILKDRLRVWEFYRTALEPWVARGVLQLPHVPEHCVPNGHLFYVVTQDGATRDALMQHLQAAGIQAVFHYLPLHRSIMGQRHGRFVGEDRYTTALSERLLRLPLYYQLDEASLAYIVETIGQFYD